MDYTTSDDPPAAFDFGADGNLYVTSNDFSGGIAPARDTGTLVISPATGTVTRSFDVDNHGGTDNHVAVDASGDLFVVNGDGGIDVRSTATGDVIRTLASASADKPFGQLLYAPVFVPTLSAPVAFTKGKAVQLATTAGRVTVRMAGPGAGEIVADPLVADGVVVSLSDTTTRSTFSLTGPAAATLAGVQSPAAINTFAVVHAATAGTLDFDSGLSRLNLAGLSGDVSVTGSQPLRVALGAVAGGSSLLTGGPVTSLSVASWGAGTTDDPSEISAVSIGTLVSRGEFSAQVKLTSAELSLGRATFGSLAGASITMPGSAGIITVAGDMTDSQVMVGATYQAGTPSDQAIANFTGVPVTLKRFSQRATATFSDSDVGAYLIRSASTGRAVSTGGTLTGVASHVIVSATVPPLNGGRALRNLNGVTSPRFYDESGVVVQAY